MKNRNILFFILFLGIYSCRQDEDLFIPQRIEEFNISSKAVAGGAMLYYSLPDDANIFAMNVRYKDCRGEDVLKVGGYGGDSLFIDGFNEAQTNITAQISFVNRQNKESEPIETTFSTLASAAYSFFDQAQVMSSWDGFQVLYTTPEQVSGMLHVFYIGTNPLTQQADTILLKSTPFTNGGDTLLFTLQQKQSLNTIVLRTEDSKGYRVRQQVYENIEAYTIEKLGANELYFNHFNLGIEEEIAKSGSKYLFDGDLTGEQRRQAGKQSEFYSFVAGPAAVGKPFIIDLKEDKIPAQIRIYGMLKKSSDPLYPQGTTQTGFAINGRMENKLPCDVTVFAGNDPDPNGEWLELGKFSQDPNLANSSRWCERCSNWYFGEYKEDPAYMEISFMASPQRFRYLKLVVNDVFDYFSTAGDQNYDEYVTMHELEVYIKKD